MGATSNYALPYLELGDPPDIPLTGRQLAVATDAVIKALADRVTAAEAALAAIAAAPVFYRARVKLTSPAAAITFSGIPSTLRWVKLMIRARGVSGGSLVTEVRVNNDSSAKYDSGAVTGNGFSSTVGWGATTAGTAAATGLASGGSSTAGYFGYSEVTFIGWNNSGADLGIVVGSYSQELGTVKLTNAGGARYLAAGPYTRLDVLLSSSINLDTGSEVSLIGEYV